MDPQKSYNQTNHWIPPLTLSKAEHTLSRLWLKRQASSEVGLPEYALCEDPVPYKTIKLSKHTPKKKKKRERSKPVAAAEKHH
ncbi:MAG: hypothetical protein WCO56_02900 [Verrucomicrobiota bacterium]